MEETKKIQDVTRLFEQPHDAVSFYSDLAQVSDTGNEVFIQFYETVPGPPGPTGEISNVKTRLKATVVLNHKHARNLATMLLEKVGDTKK